MKLRGTLLFVLGIAWIAFVCKFDSLMRKTQGFGMKAGLAFVMGIVMLVNGIRIFRRR